MRRPAFSVAVLVGLALVATPARVDGERTQKSDAAPRGREVRSHEGSVTCGSECPGAVSRPSCPGVVPVGHERGRVRHTEERSKGQLDDLLGVVDL